MNHNWRLKTLFNFKWDPSSLHFPFLCSMFDNPWITHKVSPHHIQNESGIRKFNYLVSLFYIHTESKLFYSSLSLSYPSSTSSECFLHSTKLAPTLRCFVCWKLLRKRQTSLLHIPPQNYNEIFYSFPFYPTLRLTMVHPQQANQNVRKNSFIEKRK